jgi:hypothetical protein
MGDDFRTVNFGNLPRGTAGGRYLRPGARHDPEPPLTDDRFRATRISNFPIDEHCRWGMLVELIP